MSSSSRLSASAIDDGGFIATRSSMAHWMSSANTSAWTPPEDPSRPWTTAQQRKADPWLKRFTELRGTGQPSSRRSPRLCDVFSRPRTCGKATVPSLAHKRRRPSSTTGAIVWEECDTCENPFRVQGDNSLGSFSASLSRRLSLPPPPTHEPRRQEIGTDDTARIRQELLNSPAVSPRSSNRGCTQTPLSGTSTPLSSPSPRKKPVDLFRSVIRGVIRSRAVVRAMGGTVVDPVLVAKSKEADKRATEIIKKKLPDVEDLLSVPFAVLGDVNKGVDEGVGQVADGECYHPGAQIKKNRPQNAGLSREVMNHYYQEREDNMVRRSKRVSLMVRSKKEDGPRLSEIVEMAMNELAETSGGPAAGSAPQGRRESTHHSDKDRRKRGSSIIMQRLNILQSLRIDTSSADKGREREEREEGSPQLVLPGPLKIFPTSMKSKYNEAHGGYLRGKQGLLGMSEQARKFAPKYPQCFEFEDYCMLRQAFNQLDTRSEGRLGIEQLCAQGVTLAGRSIDTAAFYKLDRENTGYVTFNQLLRHWYPSIPYSELMAKVKDHAEAYEAREMELGKDALPWIERYPPSVLNQICEIFDRLDVDRSGKLTFGQFKSLLSRKGAQAFQEDELLKLFKKHCPKGDSRITLGGFVELVKHAYPEIGDFVPGVGKSSSKLSPRPAPTLSPQHLTPEQVRTKEGLLQVSRQMPFTNDHDREDFLKFCQGAGATRRPRLELRSNPFTYLRTQQESWKNRQKKKDSRGSSPSSRPAADSPATPAPPPSWLASRIP